MTRKHDVWVRLYSEREGECELATDQASNSYRQNPPDDMVRDCRAEVSEALRCIQTISILSIVPRA